MLMLVFSLASLGNAALIEVVIDGLGDAGHAGTAADKLEVGETIYLQIILDHNPYPGWPSYDGYALDIMDVDLHVSGAGSIGVGMKTTKTGDVPALMYHPGFDEWYQPDPIILNNQIARLMGRSSGYILGSAPPYGTGPASPPTQLVWNMYVTSNGTGGIISIDLTLYGTTHYWNYSTPIGAPYGPDYNATEGDLGDLVLYVVPEPMSIVLLGVGGLFLMRRRR
ncbi:MAG: PEP-CTERM sorting domain-containing protein [Planctomycetota bacterium]